MTRAVFEYALVRASPRVERGEHVNVGVVLYCQATDFLGAAWHVDAARLRAVHPGVDVDQVCEALRFVDGVCAGDERGGAASGHPLGQRFGFLKAPRSTVLQPGPVHGGLADDPAAALDHLATRLVR